MCVGGRGGGTLVPTTVLGRDETVSKPTIGDMSGLPRLGNPRCASQATHRATHLRSIRRDQKQGSTKFTGLFSTPSPSLYNHVLCLFQAFDTR